MRTVTSTSAMTYEQMFKNKDHIRSMLANKPHMETGGTLNDQGDDAFRARVNALLRENGIEGNVAFGRILGNITLGVDENGRHIVTNSHPDKAKIESLLNSDEKLQQIKNDPANAFGQKPQPILEEPDSVYISEEARLLYEQRARDGEQAFASSQEETAEILAWMDKRGSTNLSVEQLNECIANGGELKQMTNTLTFPEEQMSANPNFDFSDVGILRSGDMKEFMHARSWMETEVKAVLEKAGLAPSKFSGVKMAVYDDKVEVAQGQENLSEEDRLKIQAALNTPANEELRNVIGRVLADEQAMSGTLRRATGLSLTDWAEVAEQSGGDLANVNNEGMQKLLESDPDLAAALSQLVGGTGIVGNTYLPKSAEEEAEQAVSALGWAVSTYLKEADKAGFMSSREVAALKKNLVIEGDSFDNLRISGTKNQHFLNAVQEYFDHYTSGNFGDFLRRGAFLNQALGLGDADAGVNFSMTFAEGVADATYAYGDGAKQSARTWHP